MKRHTWTLWTITGLMAALMLLSAVPDVLRVPGAVSVFKHLGYPSYLLLFLGTAKMLGVAAVLVITSPRERDIGFLADAISDLTTRNHSRRASVNLHGLRFWE
jgi:hypothetical protein